MPNLPRPKLLPTVKYAPPQNAPGGMQAQGGVGSNPYGGMGAGEAWDNQRAQAMGLVQGQAQAQAAPVVNYQPAQTAVGGTQPPAVGNTPNPEADRRYDSLEESRMRQMQAMNTAVTNNQNNTKVAQAAGDTASLARLNAEWERIQQSPLWKQMYGGSDPNAMKQRLVNVYMNPKNSAAQNDLAGALSSAVADDVWAQQATQAFGRPPNQLEWDEHWKAMNVGGRDPLEGHPQAIQNIKATMQSFQQGNQQTAYDDYSNWAGLGH